LKVLSSRLQSHQMVGRRHHGDVGDPVPLGDGSVMVMRKPRSGDAPLLADGLAGLGWESGRLRLLSGRSSLPRQPWRQKQVRSRR
jgi:hypothetical protein